jgi:hypothetical protein
MVGANHKTNIESFQNVKFDTRSGPKLKCPPFQVEMTELSLRNSGWVEEVPNWITSLGFSIVEETPESASIISSTHPRFCENTFIGKQFGNHVTWRNL